MNDEKPIDATEQARKEKLAQLEKDFCELESYKSKKLKLLYPTFFVPDWTSETCATWKYPYAPKKPNKLYETHYGKYYRPILGWINDVVDNKGYVHYVTFSEQETSTSFDFVSLGKYLKNQIVGLAKNSPVNLVGHSMGGLDIRAAILDNEEPKLSVKNVITVGTPNNGVAESWFLGFRKIREWLQYFKGYTPYHIAQARSMFSKGPFIQLINSVENRLKLLNSVDRFYIFMGFRDFVVKGSPKLNVDGIDENLRKKVKPFPIPFDGHMGEFEITQDPSTILPILKVLSGVEIKDNLNRGTFAKGIYKPS